jgi:hypothetical protein
MNQQRDQTRTSAAASAPAYEDDLAAGHCSSSAQLAAPAYPIASGLLQRKARDSNGVTEGADQSVAAASQTSGQTLPEPIQRKFESSLGSDLSSVRIHTGSESAAAAHAVGARAYTTGQDIHFAAGQYDPTSAAGQHLLAHEVAHTVQQAGGARGAQYKLEVSSPGDALEAEADRVADSMVTGAATSVTGAPSSTARAVQRVTTDSETIRAQQQNELRAFKPPTVLKGMTVNADISRCDQIIGLILDENAKLGQLQRAEHDMATQHEDDSGYIPQTRGDRYIAINNATRVVLDAMRQGAQKQQFDHSFFEPAYQTLSTDFVKLQSAVHMIQANHIGVAGAADAVSKTRKTNNIVSEKLDSLGPRISEMRTAGAKIPEMVTNAEATFREVMHKIDLGHIGLPKLEDSTKQTEADAKVKAVNADLAAAKGAVASIQSTVTGAMSLYGGPEVMAAVNGMVDKAKDGLATGVDKIATADDAAALKKGAEVGGDQGGEALGLKDKLAEAMTNYQGRIARASGEADELRKQSSEIQIELDGRELLNLQVTLSEKTLAVLTAVADFERKKAALTDVVKAIEVELKKMGGSAGKEVSAAIQLETDVARFDSQCDVAIALGEKEQANAKEAEKARKDAAGDYRPGAGSSSFGPDTEIASAGGGRSYWTCEVSRAGTDNDLADLSGFKLEEHPVIFNVLESDKHEHSQVMSDAVQSRLDHVKQWKQEAAAYRSQIEAVLNIQTG